MKTGITFRSALAKVFGRRRTSPGADVPGWTGDAYRAQTLKRLQGTSFEMGVTAVLGSAAGLLVRLLIPTPEYVGLRVLLLPLTALVAYFIVVAPSVRAYGAGCMATIFLISLNSYLGALGTGQPLLYFVPAAAIVVIASSFFWITSRQWAGGALACYLPFLPFIVNPVATRTETVFSIFFAAMALVTSYVSHQRIQDFQRRAFDQEARLAQLSITDALTGARSRAEFLQQAEIAAAEARVTGAPLTLLYLDIDHFKRLNDAHGHSAGDAVLRAMSDVLQRGLRNTDVFGRLGGEEFGVLLSRQNERDALQVADRLRTLLSAVSRPDGRLTVSVGIAGLRDGESIAQTLHRADLAMLQAKRAGRDAVHLAG